LTIFSCKNKQDNTRIPSENSYSSPSTRNSTYSTEDKNNDEESEKYPDDTYCAEVEYYNPNTGTRSTYTLTVEVQSNEIVEINFPNGGWLDNDHFSGADLEEDGTASFTSDRGYQYEITIVGHSSNCFENVPRAVQCRGETEDGEQCEHMTDNPNGLCWQHQDQE
jgi:hypothetical protein